MLPQLPQPVLSQLPLPKISRGLLVAVAVVSFIGFADAAYLTIQHYNQGILPCVIFKGCDQVLTSSYAKVLGIPISLIGAVYYLTILISALLFLDTKNPKALLVLGYLPVAGLAVSLGLVYLQLFVIKAVCFYCMFSAISSTILFIFGLKILNLRPD